MSVTLKMADGDAETVELVLRTVATLQRAALEGKETVPYLKILDRHFSSTVSINNLNELAGAFKTAVKANSK